MEKIGNKVTIVVPILNEIDGLQVIMPRIKPDWYDQLIILDGGSKDGSIEYAKKFNYQIHSQKAVGLKQGMIENFTNIKGDIIITFSPDGNSIPELIPELIKQMNNGYDMVIASRYLKTAKSEDDTLVTRLGNFLFTKTIGFLFGYPYTDALVIYRAYRKEIVEKLGMLEKRSEFYEDFIGRYVSWEPQLSMRCARHRLKISEIPGSEPKRVSDENKSGILPASRIGHFRAGLACLFLVLDELYKKMCAGSKLVIPRRRER